MPFSMYWGETKPSAKLFSKQCFCCSVGCLAAIPLFKIEHLCATCYARVLRIIGKLSPRLISALIQMAIFNLKDHLLPGLIWMAFICNEETFDECCSLQKCCEIFSHSHSIENAHSHSMQTRKFDFFLLLILIYISRNFHWKTLYQMKTVLVNTLTDSTQNKFISVSFVCSFMWYSVCLW